MPPPITPIEPGTTEAGKIIVAAAMLWREGNEAEASTLLATADCQIGYPLLFGLYIRAIEVIAALQGAPFEQIMRQLGMAFAMAEAAEPPATEVGP